MAQNQKVQGSGFKAKGDVNSPKIEPPMNSKRMNTKQIISGYKPRYIYCEDGQRRKFKF